MRLVVNTFIRASRTINQWRTPPAAVAARGERDFVEGKLFNQDQSPGTIVVEYTTFHDMEGTRSWRSNSNASVAHGDLTWLIHTIDINHMVPDMAVMWILTTTLKA